MKRIVLAVWFLSVMLGSYLSLTPRIQIPLEFSGGDKVAHLLSYFWLGLLPFFGFSTRRAALTGACLMALLGIGLEIAQHCVPGRCFSWADMVADCAGVAFGVLSAKYIKKSVRLQGLFG